jgi:hypothetical protein
VVLGQLKTIVIMFTGYLIFGSDPGIISICDVVVALGGMSFYTYLGLKDCSEQQETNVKIELFPGKA